jgi:hypothetical protein
VLHQWIVEPSSPGLAGGRGHGDAAATESNCHCTTSAVMRAERARADHRTYRLAHHEAVVNLRQQGWSFRAIAHHFDLECIIVRRFLRAEGIPERAFRAPVPGLIDPLRPHLPQRWRNGYP